MDWQTEWQPGVMADSPALIPLVGNNSRFQLSFPMQMPIFIQSTWRLGFTFRSAYLDSYLIIFLFIIYLH